MLRTPGGTKCVFTYHHCERYASRHLRSARILFSTTPGLNDDKSNYRDENKTRLSLAGIFPPITTPFHSNGSVAWEHMEMNVQKWNQVPFAGMNELIDELVCRMLHSFISLVGTILTESDKLINLVVCCFCFPVHYLCNILTLYRNVLVASNVLTWASFL